MTMRQLTHFSHAAWPEQDNEYRIVDMQLPQLLSEPHGRYKLMKDTGRPALSKAPKQTTD